MYTFTVKEIAEAVSGQIISGSPDKVFASVSTDTRRINEGDLFVALLGERFDAHDFLDKAVAGGAGGLIVSRPAETGEWSGPVILVKDTLAALQALAAHNRSRFAGPVIGVTGSNGKTTTKDMIASVLSVKHKTLKTEANLNNEIGLPLTLLKLDGSFGAAVLEMGMRGLGEIDLLAGITKPDGAVITNIGETHLERLGSVDNIARAKGEILDHIGPQGFAVLNGDDRLVRGQADRCRGRVIYYGTTEECPVRAVDISVLDGKKAGFTAVTPAGRTDIVIPLPGRHNVQNALAALAAGLEAGLSLAEIREGLEKTRITSMRLEVIEGEKITIINDAYNANPDSAKAALGILSDMGHGRRRVAILGDMYELGSRTTQGHQEVGLAAARLQIDVLVTVGRLATDIALGAGGSDEPPAEIITFTTTDEVNEYLGKFIRPGDIVLVKGSRGMKMENVVAGLTALVL